MLKIKDNVNFDELEKLGFKPEVWWVNTIVYVCDETAIIQKNREITTTKYQDNTDLNVFLDTIYDLIQAGLIEKVGEDNEL